ncbi:MAG TPA: hypothetical protein VMU93_08690 [Caulobacteraceae bacterium]|nr:hypothetical protein [Caulobacteraceae bacterium]
MHEGDAPPTGRAAVLALVKRQGPVRADAAAAALELTSMAVRQHLAALERDGLAASETLPGPRGRPAKLWRTTAKADAGFADAHAALAADLITQMRRAFGEAGLERLLALRTADQEGAYRAGLAGAGSLEHRLERLAEIRSAEGYMAEVRREPESGAWLLVEHHCPVCAAARLCTGLCREELDLFRRVLGDGLRIERLAHALAGAGRCVYRITPVAP